MDRPVQGTEGSHTSMLSRIGVRVGLLIIRIQAEQLQAMLIRCSMGPLAASSCAGRPCRLRTRNRTRVGFGARHTRKRAKSATLVGGREYLVRRVSRHQGRLGYSRGRAGPGVPTGHAMGGSFAQRSACREGWTQYATRSSWAFPADGKHTMVFSNTSIVGLHVILCAVRVFENHGTGL